MVVRPLPLISRMVARVDPTPYDPLFTIRFSMRGLGWIAGFQTEGWGRDCEVFQQECPETVQMAPIKKYFAFFEKIYESNCNKKRKTYYIGLDTIYWLFPENL